MAKGIKMQDIKNLGKDELNDKLLNLKKSLMQYRFQLKTGKLERQSLIRQTKRDIARIMTAMNLQTQTKQGEKK